MSADEVDDLFRARELVEAEMVGLGVEHMTEEDLARLEELAKAVRAADFRLPEVEEEIAPFWEHFVQACRQRDVAAATSTGAVFIPARARGAESRWWEDPRCTGG